MSYVLSEVRFRRESLCAISRVPQHLQDGALGPISRLKLPNLNLSSLPIPFASLTGGLPLNGGHDCTYIFPGDAHDPWCQPCVLNKARQRDSDCRSPILIPHTQFFLLAIVTNGQLRSGGPYFLISRTLGAELGGAIGLLLLLKHVIAAVYYLATFGEIVQLSSSVGTVRDRRGPTYPSLHLIDVRKKDASSHQRPPP
jgi:hypothetical protein